MQVTEVDRRALTARQLSVADVARMVSVIRQGPPRIDLIRPCTAGDGIDALGTRDEDAWRGVRRRVALFVPASGAATRLFAGLRTLDGGGTDTVASRVLEAADQLALYDSQAAGTALEQLLRWAEVPKALLPFHRSSAGPRTAIQEHLIEGSRIGAEPLVAHFTARPGDEAAYRDNASACGVACQVDLSTQDPCTDTIALANDDLPFRVDGDLLWRPGGHGALHKNLAEVGGDILLVKNIDNIVAAHAREEVVTMRRRLVGRLARIEAEAHSLLRALEGGADPAAAVAYLERCFGAKVEPDAAFDQLHRPIRLCAMVPVEGHAGGGPFWVSQPGRGESCQIIEGVQIQPDQVATARAGTHFNPVDMALSVRDHHGNPYDLRRFVDHDRVLVVHKTFRGRPLRALELPGLWNGAMAGWNTVFVEFQASCFQPVKRLGDLLGPAHATSV